MSSSRKRRSSSFVSPVSRWGRRRQAAMSFLAASSTASTTSLKFSAEKGGRSALWQRYEEATVRQRRPADPTDPGDAADLSIMGYQEGSRSYSPNRPRPNSRRHTRPRAFENQQFLNHCDANRGC